jgi:acyl carrier protein
MGLDTVELVMAFEEEFDIAIENKDAEQMETPGNVADYIISRVRTSSDDPCHSQNGFYRIRAILTDEFDRPPEAIHPNTLLEDIITGDIRDGWARIEGAIGIDNFPKLQRSPLLVQSAVLGVPGLISVSLYYSGFSGLLAIAGFFIMAAIADQLTSNLRSRIPPRLSTVSALIPFLTSTSTRVWSREQVLARVLEITADQLDIRIEEIGEDSHFVRDLGAD